MMDADEPVPVVPLPYETTGGDGWATVATVMRGVTWLQLFRFGLTIAEYGFNYCCYAVQTPAERTRDLLPLTQQVLGLPLLILSVGSFVAATRCLQLQSWGRRWMVRLAIVSAIADPVVTFVICFYYVNARQYWRYGVAFEAYHFGLYTVAAVYSIGVSLATAAFYRLPAVKQLFAEGAAE